MNTLGLNYFLLYTIPNVDTSIMEAIFIDVPRVPCFLSFFPCFFSSFPNNKSSLSNFPFFSSLYTPPLDSFFLSSFPVREHRGFQFSSCVKSLKLGTFFFAGLSILLIFLIFVSLCGDDTTSAYSNTACFAATISFS